MPEGGSATIQAVLGADDLASLSVGPLSLTLGPRGPYGGGTYREVSGSASIAPGTYRVVTTYSNISLPPGIPNVAIFHADISLSVDGEEVEVKPATILPIDNDDEGDTPSCPLLDCGCRQDENGAGDNGEPDADAACGGNAGGSVVAAFAMAADADEGAAATVTSSSGAGRQMLARGGLQDMLWRMNFSTFRGMAGIPDGALEHLNFGNINSRFNILLPIFELQVGDYGT